MLHLHAAGCLVSAMILLAGEGATPSAAIESTPVAASPAAADSSIAPTPPPTSPETSTSVPTQSPGAPGAPGGTMIGATRDEVFAKMGSPALMDNDPNTWVFGRTVVMFHNDRVSGWMELDRSPGQAGQSRSVVAASTGAKNASVKSAVARPTKHASARSSEPVRKPVRRAAAHPGASRYSSGQKFSSTSPAYVRPSWMRDLFPPRTTNLSHREATRSNSHGGWHTSTHRRK